MVNNWRSLFHSFPSLVGSVITNAKGSTMKNWRNEQGLARKGHLYKPFSSGEFDP